MEKEISKTKLTEEEYRIPIAKQAEWKAFLQKYGFVVIANYLPESLCEEYVSQFWDIMEYLSDGALDRKDQSTQVLGKNYPSVMHGGMIQYIGHSKPQWELRRLCQPLFERIWGTNDLKSSFDGFCFMNGRRNYQPRQDNAFLHVDQSPTKDFIWSYQGIMTLSEAGQNGGGFVCVPGSHKYHHKYFQEKKLLNLKDNWYVVPEQDKTKKQLANTLKVNTKAGDFILFESRTFHCNTVPKIRQCLRVCTYICMLPSEKVPENIKQRRKVAVEKRKTSNHHAGDGFKTFPVLPRYLQDRKKFQQMINKINSYQLKKKTSDLFEAHQLIDLSIDYMLRRIILWNCQSYSN